ncbi:MAG: transcription antitermination factor NusB [Candidatus Krumholzibacteriia bacterium]|nr:transcription antitermination factor NusB [Candidatus Latescibacterota bacterium]
MGRRRKARELALQSLYELEAPGKDPGAVLRDQADRRGSADETRDYAGRLVTWVRADERALDAALSERLRNWDLDRVSLLLRLILRQSLAESRHAPEVPARVILDEAVELARKYDSEEGASFANGLLAALLSDERPGELAEGGRA